MVGHMSWWGTCHDGAQVLQGPWQQRYRVWMHCGNYPNKWLIWCKKFKLSNRSSTFIEFGILYAFRSKKLFLFSPIILPIIWHGSTLSRETFLVVLNKFQLKIALTMCCPPPLLHCAGSCAEPLGRRSIREKLQTFTGELSRKAAVLWGIARPARDNISGGYTAVTSVWSLIWIKDRLVPTDDVAEGCITVWDFAATNSLSLPAHMRLVCIIML